MARVSRSSKKQPAFDPSELEDLIYTPAVGSGVGSHLVGSGEGFPALKDMATVAMLELPTVAESEIATVDNELVASVDRSDVSTVDSLQMASVDISDMSTVASQPVAMVDTFEVPTVANKDVATVDDMSRSGQGRGTAFWITEEGSLVPEGRVRQIRVARDVISWAEESVYDTLWTACTGDHSDGDLSRVVQAGYDYLVKHTELSKRTIQRIVEKLIDKDVIAIERPADIYQRSSTVYRVFSYQTVLDRHIEKGRLHVAKLGPGFSYVRPLSEIRLQ